jgi:hypothetical protein
MGNAMRRPAFIRPATTPHRHGAARVRSRRTRESSVLGADHPLVRVGAALESVVSQSLAVGAILTGSIIALREGATWAGALVVSAAVVLLAFMFAAAALRQRKRDCALDLIIAGRDELPLAAVQRERRRLLAPRTRTVLTKHIDAILEEASGPHVLSARVPVDAAVVRAVAPDLRAVIQQLRADHPAARGIALTKRLVTNGDSPLYGHDPRLLREEITRVRHLLSG